MWKIKRQKWQAWELAWIDNAIEHITKKSCSISSQTDELWKNVLEHRTFNAIRSKINEKLKADSCLLSKCTLLSKCKEKNNGKKLN